MEIFFTKRAFNNYTSIKEYIANDFGDIVLNTFKLKFINFLEILKNYPELGNIEVFEKGIRGFQFSKQTRIFYRIKGKRIIILALFDVRQNPIKKNF